MKIGKLMLIIPSSVNIDHLVEKSTKTIFIERNMVIPPPRGDAMTDRVRAVKAIMVFIDARTHHHGRFLRLSKREGYFFEMMFNISSKVTTCFDSKI